MKKIEVGDIVAWKWGNGIAQGVVEEITHEKITIESKGSLITRRGSAENPAVIIRHKSGNLVLKLQSELLITSSDKV